MFGPGRTLSGLAAVHREVSWLVGFQAHLLHPWTVNLDVLWMAALANHHLQNHRVRPVGPSWRWNLTLTVQSRVLLP